MFIGCKDGTLLELNCRTFKLEREMENDLPILSITALEDGMLILAHSVRSGYLEERSALQVVRPGQEYDFTSVATVNLVATGDINQVVLNPDESTELLLACQRGLFVAKVTVTHREETAPRRGSTFMKYVSKIADGRDGSKERHAVTIELQEERYFEGQRVSQVINSNVNQLLVALWEEPGYFKIDRRRTGLEMTHIEDETNVANNFQCTDLVGLRCESDEAPSYVQYFIARTQAAINIVDTVKEKVYCLQQEPNYKFKYRKTVVMPRDIAITNGVAKDHIHYQIVYVTASGALSAGEEQMAFAGGASDRQSAVGSSMDMEGKERTTETESSMAFEPRSASVLDESSVPEQSDWSSAPGSSHRSMASAADRSAANIVRAMSPGSKAASALPPRPEACQPAQLPHAKKPKLHVKVKLLSLTQKFLQGLELINGKL